MNTLPRIQTPTGITIPERHADRIVAEMMRHLAQQRADLWETLGSIIKNANDGAPAGQRKLEQKIKQIAKCHVRLHPGKRGKYSIDVYDMTGFDPERDSEIKKGDPIPAKPWLAQWVTYIESSGNGRGSITMDSYLLVLITHHALSRAAQRFGARTMAHMLNIASSIGGTVTRVMAEKKHQWLDTPPEGWPIPITADASISATVILKRHETRSCLVAATVYGDIT